MLHTTFIPYREFESVLGIKGIDEYIRYGGTMSMSGTHYNEDSTFTSKKKTDEYLNTAIAHNIQHSLKYYQGEGHFRNLYSLYQKNELTSAINHVVEDMMEDIVLPETKMAFPKKQVFKLKFAVGEFDMVVADPDSCTCCIYEIKHSMEAVSAQYRHLIDAEKCASTEFSFGRITGRFVIYRGENFTENGVEYVNVEKYLKSL